MSEQERVKELQEALANEKMRNEILEKAAANRKATAAKSQEEVALEAELAELVAKNSTLESDSSERKPPGTKCFYDSDGRVFFLFDYRGAPDRAEQSLAFRRMSCSERLRTCITGQKLDVNLEKLRGALEASSEGFFLASTSTSTVSAGWETASRLPQIRPLPFWTDLNKFEKFINGRWKRYDYGNISLADFFFGAFEDANVEHIRIAVANLELACVCCFGKEWIACSMTLQAHLASAEWLNRQVPYLRFVLENFLCDFFLRLSVEYVATTGEPTSLLLNTDVVSLFVVST